MLLVVLLLVALFGDRPGVLSPRRLSSLRSLLMSMVTVAGLDAPFASPDSGSGSGSGCLLLLFLQLLVVVALLGDRPGVLPRRRLSALCILLMSMVMVLSGSAVYFRRYLWICRLRCEFQS